MLKKMMVIFALLAAQVTHAEICPSVKELQNNQLNGWQAFDLDNGEPLSSNDLKLFKRDLITFAFAEWIIDAPEGAGQCHYQQDDSRPDHIEAYLAKNTKEPDKMFGNWREIGYDVSKCDKNRENCRFLDP